MQVVISMRGRPSVPKTARPKSPVWRHSLASFLATLRMDGWDRTCRLFLFLSLSIRALLQSQPPRLGQSGPTKTQTENPVVVFFCRVALARSRRWLTGGGKCLATTWIRSQNAAPWHAKQTGSSEPLGRRRRDSGCPTSVHIFSSAFGLTCIDRCQPIYASIGVPDVRSYSGEEYWPARECYCENTNEKPMGVRRLQDAGVCSCQLPLVLPQGPTE